MIVGRRLSRSNHTGWQLLNEQIIVCERCPRLREYCREIAEVKRRAYQEWDYWGRPVANLGDPRARLLIVGLAPAAHGANRTGRLFTGDRSGEWLFRALHKAGFANQPHATDVHDGLTLLDCAITGMAHCAPPDNKPLPTELKNCQAWLQQTIDLLQARVFIALGGIAWRGVVSESRRRGWLHGRIPQFGHGAKVALDGNRWLLGSYHPSQQNTFTGRLTEEMFDAVFNEAKEILKTGLRTATAKA